MLTRNQLGLLWNIEVACQRCIRAAKYFEVASGSQKKVWAFTQNCYGGNSVIHWCQVFGSRSEPTHYSHLFDNGMLAQMNQDAIAGRLRIALNMDEDQYLAFWQVVKEARDRFLIHNEFSSPDRPVFPDTDLLITTCLEMRNIVREIVESESAEDFNFHGNIRSFTSYHSNEQFLREIHQETVALAQSLSE